ncbi:MAG: N-acetyl-alpha-D-glucosaminyl L-malate synthase BshA [bacterium]
MTRLPAIGITCYPTQGGSGIIASELGLNLARSGYEVHFITSAMPLRLQRYEGNIFYHQVEMATYPVFQNTPYTLSLATMMSQVALRHNLDILHVHYAIPHAASGFLAREMVGADRLKLITTLHGTDITLVGQEPSFFPITKFLIERSDAVTAVSQFLRRETVKVFGIQRPIEVIPNFVDTRRFHPREDPKQRARFAAPDEKLVGHASNFRPVKNVPAVVEVFSRLSAAVPCRLVLLGDGPEKCRVQDQVDALGLTDRVQFLGQVENMAEVMALADLVLLPSLHESFGLVALEAMSCGCAVIATNNGGTEEFIDSGHNGYLCAPEDIDGMTKIGLNLLKDDTLRQQVAEEARRDAVEKFGARCVLKDYLQLYDRVMDGAGA